MFWDASQWPGTTPINWEETGVGASEGKGGEVLRIWGVTDIATPAVVGLFKRVQVVINESGCVPVVDDPVGSVSFGAIGPVVAVDGSPKSSPAGATQQ